MDILTTSFPLKNFNFCNCPMLNYDPKKDIVNPKRCQIYVQRLEGEKSDVIFPNLDLKPIF